MQPSITPRLFGVTKPLPFESPSSWAQRVCQQYDLTYRRFLACFGLRASRDIDLAFATADYKRVAKVCGLLESDFFAMQMCFGRCKQNKWLLDLMGFRDKKAPSYRYCPECWKTDTVPYLRLEWRFPLWRACPDHRVALRDACQHCRLPLQMQRAVLGGTVAPHPVASLAHCLMCGADMRFGTAERLVSEDGSLEAAIAVQRAHLAAVVHGYFMIHGCGARRYPPRRLAQWLKYGLLTAR